MTTSSINTIEDLFRVLDENPEWMDALRARILTKELLELPERHTALTDRVDVLTERVDILTESVDSLTDRVDALAAEVSALTAEVRAFIEATNRRLDNIDSRLDRMEGDNASLKGFGAEYRAGIEIVNIVEHLGKTWMRTLGRDEIVAFERAANIRGIPRAHLLSYRAADIIAEATEEDGTTCYVVVEVSYTANGRDTTRATRSAGLLSRFTGINAYPAIAGFRTDNATQELIDDGQIHFYELEEIR